MLHTVKHPGNPAWSCCRENPEAIGVYADGSAGVICAKDAHHFTNDPERELRPLPEDWKPETVQDMYRRIVEDIRQAHHEAACADDQRDYYPSQAAFKAAIHAAYPDVDSSGVYGLWIDCMETVAYCVDTFRKLDREDRRRFIAMGGGFDAC
jgi:hypothetical protein